MSYTVSELATPADEATVRAHADELIALARRHGIGRLRYASPGRIVGHIAADRDLFDVFAFERAAHGLLGAEIEVFSDAVLTKEHVSPDLVAAREL